MNKKQLIEQILSKMDEKDLEDILNSATQEEETGRHEIKPKRRGGGFNKKNKKDNRRPESESIITKTEKSVTTTENKFDNMLKDLKMTSEEVKELDSLSSVDDTVQRKRTKRPSTLTKAKCVICGKEEKVSQSLIIGSSYRCNACCCNSR